MGNNHDVATVPIRHQLPAQQSATYDGEIEFLMADEVGDEILMFSCPPVVENSGNPVNSVEFHIIRP